MRTKSIMIKKTYLGVVLVLSSAASMAEPMAYRTESGIEFIPTVGVFYEGNDNIAKADQGENVESVNIWGVEPSLLTKIERNQYRADLLYKLSGLLL